MRSGWEKPLPHWPLHAWALGLVGLLALGLGAEGARAARLDGRASSVSYISESYPPDEVTEWDLINRLSLNLRGLGHPGISVHWLGTHRGELLEQGLDKSRPRTYHGYLLLEPGHGLALAVGRQWIYGGVGSGRLDGGRLSLAHANLGRLVLFGGTRGFLARDSDGFEGFDAAAFDASGVWGAQILSRTLPGRLSFAVSAARLFRANVEEGSRLGVLVNWRPGARSLLRYEHRYELSESASYFQHLRYLGRLARGSVSLTWNRRQSFPKAAEDSYILEKFGEESWFTRSFEHSLDRRTDEIRADFTRPCKLLPRWNINLELLEIFPEDEDRGDGFGIGLSRPGYAFGYRLQRGFGGEQDGLYGELRQALGKRAWAWLELNKVFYRYGEDEDFEDERVIDDEALASRLGMDVLLGDFDGTLAIEYLDNQRAGNQVRFLARLGYSFRQGALPEEE